MKIGYTGWTWLIHHEDNYKWEFEQFLKEVADLGYDCVENFAFITDYFDWDASAVRALLDRYGLELVNLYQHLKEDEEGDCRRAAAYVEFMEKIGAKYLNLQAVMWDDPPLERPTDAEKIAAYAKVCNRIGELCEAHGIKAVFHPHACTAVFRQEEIDLFLSQTSAKTVSLCLDTAHTKLAGMDPVQAFKRYASRLGYVHLKDVDPNEALHPEWPMKRFCALGAGTIDFKGVVDAIAGEGYDGVLCAELDYPAVCNYKSAMVSRRYIHDVLGM